MESAFGLQPQFNELEASYRELDDGWARSMLGMRTGMRFGHHGELLMMSHTDVYGQLEARRERYYKGSNMELLHAVQYCAKENVPMPMWLAIAFDDVFSQFLNSGTKLDDAFSSPMLPTTEKRARAVRRDWEKGGRLWGAVCEIASQHTGLDGAMKAVLRQPGFDWIGLTDAKRLVTMIDNTQTELTNGAHKPLSHFFKKSRKQAKSA